MTSVDLFSGFTSKYSVGFDILYDFIEIILKFIFNEYKFKKIQQS